MKRPKSQILLVVYGARYKPEAFRKKNKAMGSSKDHKEGVQRRSVQLAEAAKANSSVADAFRGFFGMAGPSSTTGYVGDDAERN